MEIYTVIGILFLVMVYQGVMQYLWYRERVRETRDLLDRIMATDYNQYAKARIETEKYESGMSVVGVEELERRMSSTIEPGIPI